MKELREITMNAEKAAEDRETKQKIRAETLQAKVAEQVPDVVTHYFLHLETYRIHF